MSHFDTKLARAPRLQAEHSILCDCDACRGRAYDDEVASGAAAIVVGTILGIALITLIMLCRSLAPPASIAANAASPASSSTAAVEAGGGANLGSPQ